MWTGTLAPRRALQLVGGLYDIPRSRYAALVRDNESLGWDRNSTILADIADAVKAIAVGLGGKSLHPDQMTRRPKPITADEDDKRRPATIADFDVAWFMRQL